MISDKKIAARKEIEDYFRSVARNDNQRIKKRAFDDLLDKDDKGKRILFVMPDSIGDVFLSTALFRSIKETYPEYNLYVATREPNIPVLNGNPHVFRVLSFIDQMNSQLWLEGHGDHEGYFEIAFLPYGTTQKFLSYLHNGNDKIAYKDLRYND